MRIDPRTQQLRHLDVLSSDHSHHVGHHSGGGNRLDRVLAVNLAAGDIDSPGPAESEEGHHPERPQPAHIAPSRRNTNAFLERPEEMNGVSWKTGLFVISTGRS